MRTAISTDIRLSTSMESQGNLPDLPDDEDDVCVMNLKRGDCS